ncbi:MAG: type II secretion system F family protein [bacterium]|nr:type II secretion system F family protein [bacterium]
MANWRYQARDVAGKTVKGTIEAPSIGQARTLLKAKQLVIFSVNEGGSFSLLGRGAANKVKLKLKDKIILTEQIALMIKSGLSLSDALKSVVAEGTKPAVQRMLNDIASIIEGGGNFSDALAHYPQAFDDVFIEMIKAGEKGGNLDEIMGRIAHQLEKDYDIRSKVRSALMYPIIVMTLMLGVAGIVIIFVIPRLKGVFEDAGVELPFITRALLGISDFAVKYWLWLILVVIALVILVRFALRLATVRLTWDRIRLKIPIYGGMQKKVIMARFSLGFASLISSGLPILEIFATTKGLVSNKYIERELELMSDKVENGLPFASALQESPVFPAMMTQLIRVGEKSGNLGETFWVISNFYEKDVDTFTRNLSSLLEPIIMVVLGVGVALLLMAVLQPMYNLVNVI